MRAITRAAEAVARGRPRQSFTPGGLGTRQAAQALALRDYATSSVVTAWSLAQSAVLTAFDVVFGLGVLVAVYGVDTVKALLKRDSDQDEESESADVEAGDAP